jgi:hypothetical protein
MAKPTVADVRAGYSPEKRAFESTFVWIPWVRLASFYLTPLFLRLGISAVQTTYLSIVLGILGCFLIASGTYEYVLLGVLLVHFWALADCVDGNIARYHARASSYGRFIDDFGGELVEVGLFTSVGIGLYQTSGGPLEALWSVISGQGDLHLDRGVYLAAGGLASLTVTLTKLVHLRFEMLFTTQHESSASIPEPSNGSEARKDSMVLRAYMNIISYNGIVLPFVSLAALIGALDVFAVFYCIAYTGSLLMTTSRYVLKARALES